MADLVRTVFPDYAGPCPPVSTWHGTAEPVIRDSNTAELVKQMDHGPRHQPDRRHAIQVNTLGLYQPTCRSTGFSTQNSTVCAPL